MQEEAKRFEKDTPDGASQPTSTAAPPGGQGPNSDYYSSM